MVNNQPADDAIADDAINESDATSESAASEVAVPSPRTSLRHLAIDETAMLGVAEEDSSNPNDSSDASIVPQGNAERRTTPGNEPRASVTTIIGAPLPSRPSELSSNSLSSNSRDSGAILGASAMSELLGSRPVVSLLLVSDVLAAASSSPSSPKPASAAQAMYERLARLGHIIEIVPTSGWQRVVLEAPPEVILFDSQSETAEGDSSDASLFALQRLCREIKGQAETAGCLLAVLLPTGQSTLDAALWSLWQSAGADVVLEAETAPALLQSNLELWARMVRLQRDANLLRDTLGKQVQFDDLTQLLNRRFFFQAAHREVSRSRRYNHSLSCLMIDINYFKLYNKTFGYACGDHILRTVAATIRSWTRESDIGARFGAKKFVILLPETDVDGAMMLHEKLQREISNLDFLWEGQKLPLTISIGEAERRRDATPEFASGLQSMTPEDELRLGSEAEDNAPLSIREELADLLEDADAALYVAKKGVRYPNFPITPPQGEEVVGILGSS